MQRQNPSACNLCPEVVLGVYLFLFNQIIDWVVLNEFFAPSYRSVTIVL